MLSTCEWGQDVVVQVANGLFEAVPSGVEVVHVQDPRARKVFGQGGGVLRLTGATGPIDGDDLRGAAPGFGLVDGQERCLDRLVGRSEVHLWTVDSRVVQWAPR